MGVAGEPAAADLYRYHAIVIDEGQDFDAGWLLSLESLLFEPKNDVLHVTTDPANVHVFDAESGLRLSD